MATSRTAAFSIPVRVLEAVSGWATVPRAIGSVLGHPLLDLSGDALGLALHQLVDRLEVGVRGARRQLDGGVRGAARQDLRLLLELSERDRLLDVGEPGRRRQRLTLALAQRAGHEEQEEQSG